MSEELRKVWAEARKSAVCDSIGNLLHFKCRFCTKTIVRQDYFKLHLHRQHHQELNIQNPPKNHKCPSCQLSYYTKQELNSHFNNKHSKKESTVTKPIIPQVAIVDESIQNNVVKQNVAVPNLSMAKKKVMMNIVPPQQVITITSASLSSPNFRLIIPANIKLIPVEQPVATSSMVSLSIPASNSTNLASFPTISHLDPHIKSHTSKSILRYLQCIKLRQSKEDDKHSIHSNECKSLFTARKLTENEYRSNLRFRFSTY